MAKVPTFGPGNTQLSNPKLTTQSSSVEQTQALGPGEGIETLGKAIKSSADFMYQKMDEARNYAEKAKYETYKTKTMADIMLAEDNERNPDGSPKTDKDLSSFDEKLNKAKEGYKGIFTNKEQLAKADAEWDLDAMKSSTTILSNRMKNIAMVAQVNDLDRLNTLSNAFASNQDPLAKKEIAAQQEDVILNGEKANIYSPVEAYNLRKKIKDDNSDKSFSSDMVNNIESVREKLSKNEYGFDAEKQEQALKHYEQAYHLSELQNTVDNRFTTLNKLANDELNWSNSQQFVFEMSKIDPTLATAVQNVINQRLNYTPTEENEGFAEVVRNVFDKSHTQKEVSDYLVKALSSENKNISIDKLSILVNASMARSKTLKTDVSDPINRPYDKKQSAIDAGIRSILSTFVGVESSDIITHYLQGIAEGQTAQESHNSAITRNLVKNNPDIMKYPNGRVGVDKNTGISWRYFPDGRPPERVKK